MLAEELVDYRRELAAVLARSASGQAVTYPVVESVQRDGICVEVVAPAPSLPGRLAVEAQRLALAVAAGLDVVGILAVELFETSDGRLLVNEAGDAAAQHRALEHRRREYNQFENHLRAVLDLPLGSPQAHAPYAVMVNVFGGDLPDVYSAYRHACRDSALKIHWYGKTVRPGRKVGHVTVLGDDVDDLRARARHAAGYLGGHVDGDLAWVVGDGQPVVGIVMGSDSDWSVMSDAGAVLAELGVPHEVGVVSAHRMPHAMLDYAATAAGRVACPCRGCGGRSPTGHARLGYLTSGDRRARPTPAPRRP